MGTYTQYWNRSDGYAYLVLEWIGWVRILSVGMDQMGTPTQCWNGSDGYAYPVLEWIDGYTYPSVSFRGSCNNERRRGFNEEVGFEDAFAQDMSEHCYLVSMDMEKKGRLLELEKLALSEGAAHYLETLRQRQNKDAKKHHVLRELLRHARDETHESNLLGFIYLAVSLFGHGLCVCAFAGRVGLSDDEDGSLVSGVLFSLLDGSSRTSAAGEVIVTADSKASDGVVVLFKTEYKVKFRGNYYVVVREKGMCLWAEASECCCGSFIINYSLEEIPISYWKDLDSNVLQKLHLVEVL
nr:hypothetical protein [Tanacetum cinerariifolium]